jgi:hypothetical protein
VEYPWQILDKYRGDEPVLVPEGIQSLTAPAEISVRSSSELIGMLTARRVHFWYSEAGLPTVRSYLMMLIEQIDAELTASKL